MAGLLQQAGQRDTYAAHMPQIASTCRLCPLQAVVTLPVQYRMAADIMALPNALIYGDALRCGTGGWSCPGCHRAVVLRTSLCRAALDAEVQLLPTATPSCTLQTAWRRRRWSCRPVRWERWLACRPGCRRRWTPSGGCSSWTLPLWRALASQVGAAHYGRSKAAAAWLYCPP